ncbi:MAG: hypothetical protein IKB88_02410 [Clostridia bacterium]|nr:hypothetical protein [Clostridia bacterium]
MKYYLGIDGGGTKTTAAVSDETGKIILKESGETINFYSVGMEAARNNLADVIEKLKNTLGICRFDGAFIGCSALDSDADEETINALCGGIINADRIGMSSDVYVALKASSSNCIAICGTGSMAVAEKDDGTIIAKGGWGHIVGDEGSAYSIAIRAFRECCLMCDKNERTALLESAEKFFGVDNLRKAIDLIYSPDKTKDYFAAFAKDVSSLADAGCGISKSIIIEEAKAYARTVISLLKETDNCHTLMLYGGVFQHNVLFRNEFITEIRKIYPLLQAEILDIPPEEGALSIARSLK